MKISYCVTACNEHKELQRLADLLQGKKKDTDEVVLLLDKDSLTEQVLEVSNHSVFDNKSITSLNRDFANFKNHFYSISSGDYIFQIDADELPSESLIEHIHNIIDDGEIDLFLVPRINIVNGITQEHIDKWKWNINEKGWINFPDYQTRIYKRSLEIYWQGTVHERIAGFKNYAVFPAEENYCLLHEKDIVKQESQNNLYSSY